jgi:branched-chain amino acid transport system ATP-binding protein
MAALVLEDLTMSFGALEVIKDISLDIESGERHAIIGPNGAGKTTLFNLITGWLKPKRGRILLDGQSIAGMSPRRLSYRGLARSFQRNTLFEGLTVEENLRLACQAHRRAKYDPARDRTAYKDILEKAHAAAETMALGDSLSKPVDELAYGQKRQLEVGIALCADPKILLLDEPAAGTSPGERTQLISLIGDLPRNVTLVLVEHDMDVVFEVSDRITVLDYGRLLATGRPEEIRESDAVREAYLGKSSA